MINLVISWSYIDFLVKKTYPFWHSQPPINQQWVKVVVCQLSVIRPFADLFIGSPPQTNPQISFHTRKQGCNKICYKAFDLLNETSTKNVNEYLFIFPF